MGSKRLNGIVIHNANCGHAQPLNPTNSRLCHLVVKNLLNIKRSAKLSQITPLAVQISDTLS